MMVMISVVELALTVSPSLMPTETTVPLMGLASVASVSDCWALVRSASALSMSAWSEAICSGVSVSADVAFEEAEGSLLPPPPIPYCRCTVPP